MKDIEVFEGHAWTFGNNINTESIMNSGLEYTHDEAVKHVLEVYDPDFAGQVQQNDVIVAGTNFGTSSARPAAELLKRLGVGAVICESAARLFYRNTWCIGVPVLECSGIKAITRKGDLLRVDILGGVVTNVTSGKSVSIQPIAPTLLDIYRNGGLVSWIISRKEQYPNLV